VQRNVKAMLGIGDNNSAASHTFGVAVSFLCVARPQVRVLVGCARGVGLH
jgi:hypothetical protein